MTGSTREFWRHRRRRRSRFAWLALLVASLCGHVVLLGGLVLLSTLTQHRRIPRPPPKPVSLRALDPGQWQKNRGPAPLPLGQIIDQQGNFRQPKDARYLADHNNAVARETRARRQVRAPGSTAQPMTSAGSAKARAQESAKAQSQAPSATAWQARIDGLDGTLQRTSLSQLLKSATEGTAQENVEESIASDRPGDSDGKAAGGSGAEGAPAEDLATLPEGDTTALNAREWQFASFFNRVKQAVSAQWDPQTRMKQRDPQGTHLGFERVTILAVTIDTGGAVRDLFVEQSSGLDYLDAEAMRAFQQASPFPNPPTALFQGKPGVRFAFGFKIETRSGAMQMFRTSR